jgi:hypothetical protein
MEALACRETAEYIISHEQLYVAEQVEGASEIIDWSLGKAPKNGLCLEFGIGFGRTLKRIAAQRYVHGFDSFKGLPEAWRSGLPKGTFSNAGMVKEQIVTKLHNLHDEDASRGGEIHVGWFNETLPKWIEYYQLQLERGIDYIHLDSDLYSSAVTILEGVKEYLKPGSVILFDEYWNYPGWKLDGHGEHAALMDWSIPDVAWEYIGYNPIGQEVAIRMKRNRDK